MAARLHRVFNYLEKAAPHAPGGALFIPPQGFGRLDNPQHYDVLYCSEQPEAAVAEALGAYPAFVWSLEVLKGHPSLAGSVRALATYELPNLATVCDLDEPRQLIALRLRPSLVITRDYNTTQAWALRIFRAARVPRWSGARWWSFYEARWSSIGLWRRRELRLLDVTPLTLHDPAVINAARTIGRQLNPK